MTRNALILITLLMLVVAGAQFTNLSYANFFLDPGPDLPRIYIRSNGNVEPATAPIERTGTTYKLKGNISLYTIEIQRDNIVLDGSDHLIQGNASWLGYDAGNNGVIVTGRNNVTITRLDIAQCYAGVRISSSLHITVVDNSFVNGTHMGVVVQDSTFVLIEANDFTDLFTDINVPSVSLNGSKNTIRNNRLTRSTYGIEIEGSSNVISDNKIEVLLPIILDKADSNIIARNNITGPANKGSEGVALFRDCSNNVIFGNNITGFVNQAIRTVFSCSNNTIYGNYMANNGFAVALQEGAVNNTFYGNTFTANSCKIHIDDSVEGTHWDNGTIGNYWGDYNGTDGNRDGIGDAPYTVNGYKWDTKVNGFVSFVSGQDNYPLMAPYDTEHDTVVLPQTEPFLAVLAAVAVAVVVGAGLLVYFKKRKR
jgi:parallel beta-helix repeat protein